jgi:hypothetical protein
MPGPAPTNPATRYHAKVDRRGEDECWEWTAARFEKGYGVFRLGPKQVKAHRFGYELLVGPIPVGLYVCHTCDNPPCQNPKHWFLGTHKDNAVDRERKGRGAYKTWGPLPPRLKLPRARGERSGVSKLTEEKVREIRRLYASGLSQEAIAIQVGMCQKAISNVVRRKTWAHVE